MLRVYIQIYRLLSGRCEWVVKAEKRGANSPLASCVSSGSTSHALLGAPQTASQVASHDGRQLLCNCCATAAQILRNRCLLNAE